MEACVGAGFRGLTKCGKRFNEKFALSVVNFRLGSTPNL